MPTLSQVPVSTLPPERFESILPPDRYRRFRDAAEKAGKLFAGRVVWNVNSTARGGGVAEMLRSLLAYARGAGVDARWMVIGGNTEFFQVTKRIHNHLHGAPGDGGQLGPAEQEVYESTLVPYAAELADLMRPDDMVLLHDPQTAGLIPALKATGALVVWRCHVGLDVPNHLARGAWDFLRPYVSQADTYVFSRRAFIWESLDDRKVAVIPPSIDAFSPKNQDMGPEVVDAILGVAGLIEDGGDQRAAAATFLREDGALGHVRRRAMMAEGGPLPPASARLVVQVSRWDRLKDPVGVIEGFGQGVADPDVHLVLAGPDVQAVADDPEGAEVLAEAQKAWARLPAPVRDRVHLACLPMVDLDENAAIVNALQRRADVVVQKSLAEGFGLTVSEAMWKARPVVASRIGGIQDQIVDGVSGVLVDDPTDLGSYGAALSGLLVDPEGAERLGREAQARVRDEFLGPRHLLQYLDLIEGRLASK